MAIHEREPLQILGHPSLRPELVCIMPPNFNVTMLDPGINTDDGLYRYPLVFLSRQ